MGADKFRCGSGVPEVNWNHQKLIRKAQTPWDLTWPLPHRTLGSVVEVALQEMTIQIPTGSPTFLMLVFLPNFIMLDSTVIAYIPLHIQET